MSSVKINYTGPEGRSKFVSFDTTWTRDRVLEDIGRVTSGGGLYTVLDDSGRHVISIPGRRIESVEWTHS